LRSPIPVQGMFPHQKMSLAPRTSLRQNCQKMLRTRRKQPSDQSAVRWSRPRIRRRRVRPRGCASTASMPYRSITRRTRRMCRGVMPSTCAACIQVNWRASAFVITSRRVITPTSRRTRRSMFSIARLYPIRRTFLNVYGPDIPNVYDKNF